MADLTKGLGRGLDALIPGSDSGDTKGAAEVSVSLIDVNPHQPRTVFNEVELEELAASIKKHGVLQPLVVSPKSDHFELIAGERRLRASKIAGLSTVPVIIREAEEHQKLEIAIIENVHRSNLNPIDEAISYRKLIEEFSYTQEQVAEVMGKSRASIANKIRLLNLPIEIKKAIKEEKITEGHAKALLSVDDPKKQKSLYERIIAEGLNVREVEVRAKSLPVEKDRASIITSQDDLMLKSLSDDIASYLGAKIFIKRAKRGGKIEISYYSQEELNRIYQKIKGVE